MTFQEARDFVKRNHGGNADMMLALLDDLEAGQRPERGELAYTLRSEGKAYSQSVPMDTKHDAEVAAAVLRKVLEHANAENAALCKEIDIVKLAVPLEDELHDKIADMLKHLAIEDGFTLAGVARLLVACQRRMAVDWASIGSLRMEANRQIAELSALRGLVPAKDCDAFCKACWAPWVDGHVCPRSARNS